MVNTHIVSNKNYLFAKLRSKSAQAPEGRPGSWENSGRGELGRSGGLHYASHLCLLYLRRRPMWRFLIFITCLRSTSLPLCPSIPGCPCVTLHPARGPVLLSLGRGPAEEKLNSRRMGDCERHQLVLGAVADITKKSREMKKSIS